MQKTGQIRVKKTCKLRKKVKMKRIFNEDLLFVPILGQDMYL